MSVHAACAAGVCRTLHPPAMWLKCAHRLLAERPASPGAPGPKYARGPTALNGLFTSGSGRPDESDVQPFANYVQVTDEVAKIEGVWCNTELGRTKDYQIRAILKFRFHKVDNINTNNINKEIGLKARFEESGRVM